MARPFRLDEVPPLDFVAMPWDDPWAEKQAAEKDKTRYVHYLMGKPGIGLVPPTSRDQFQARIQEVYRRCFDSPNPQDVTVLGDFAAHFPELALNCQWLAKLVKRDLDLWLVYPALIGDRDARPRILKALANGFRRAARPRQKQELKLGAEEAARFHLPEVKADLRAFCKLEVPRQLSGREEEQRIKARVHEMVQGLVDEDQRLQPKQSKLEELLLRRRSKQAAETIVSTVFHVRQRTLQSKSR